MCGRIDFHETYSFSSDMKKYYYGNIDDYLNYDELKSNESRLFNQFPTSQIITLITGQKKKLLKARWGLLPNWAKDMNFNAPINARAETIDSKPTFKLPFRKQRCIIPINGFYEWKETDKGKVPYYIKPKDEEYFMLAGIWDLWTPKDSLFTEEILSCAVVTTTANSLMEDIHHRMPVILNKDSQSVWLDETIEDTHLLKSLLRPYDSNKMEAYEVDKKVNSPAFSSKDCIVPVKKV